MTHEGKSQEEWVAVYRERRPQYEAFAHKVKMLLEELLAEANIDVVQVEARTKTVESFTAKLARRPGKYSEPLNNMLDLVGIRVIGYYLSDVARIGSLIESAFEVDPGNSWKQETRSDADRFGYASDHYVASCVQARERLPEWSAYSDLRAEIQVRTVLQHAWAAIDHKLAYKRDSDVPIELRRQ